jgi:hypothetical protein
MRKSDIKTNTIRALIFILGIIVTLFITKMWNKALPEPPIMVKEVTDSIKVTHEYNIPLNDDSLSIILEKKIKNLKLLNDYENEIDRRKEIIEKKNKNIKTPNLISIETAKKYKYKGFTQGKANAYFTLDCPDISNSKYIDFELDFFNPEFINQVAYLRLNIYKFKNLQDKESRVYVMNEFYKVNKSNDNFIRIENNLSKGKYEIMIGFTLLSEVEKEYPTFYFKRCVKIKE